MSANSQQLTLSDGRRLGFAIYGDPSGFPVFALHGLPGSRLWFSDDDEVSKRLGIRLVTVDRPGFGLSDPKKGRSFLDFADDVQELAVSLGSDLYSVFGVSGGGVFAAAVGLRHPEHIHKCGLVSTVNQFEGGKPPRDMAAANRAVFTLSKRLPWLMRFMLNQQKKMLDGRIEAYIDSIMSNTQHLCDADRAIIEQRENAEIMALHMREAYRPGVRAAVSEARLFSRDWGFDPSRIQGPVEIWHGTEDTLSPVEPIRRLAQEMPTANAHFVEGKGHFLTEEPEIWERILSSLK